jgi:hypothetical protein
MGHTASRERVLETTEPVAGARERLAERLDAFLVVAFWTAVIVAGAAAGAVGVSLAADDDGAIRAEPTMRARPCGGTTP